jgi:competence protein ComEA
MLFALPIDPNRADARTLEALPGIGPARAAAILAERERRPFGEVDDLERVAGIGPKTRRRLAPWLGLPGGAPLQRNR